MNNKRIKFGEFHLRENARNKINEVLDSNWLTFGSNVRKFEKDWATTFDAKRAVMVSSGTAADMACCMSLLELGANPGDEVIIPALSFIATANAVRFSTLTPVFCDVGWDLQIDVNLIEKLITPRTRAIMPVGLMGKLPQMDRIEEIAGRNNLYIILDGCESTGAKYKNSYGLNYADWETASHYIAHLVMGGSEGGTVTTNDHYLADLLESIRSHGRKPNSLYFDHKVCGLNMKNDEITAVIANSNLDIFQETFDTRRKNLFALRDAVKPYEDMIWFSDEDPQIETICPHAFQITFKKEGRIEGLKKVLDNAGIEWKRNFGSMPHHGAFNYLELSQSIGFHRKLDEFPKALHIGNNGLHVACHQYLSEDDVSYMCDVIVRYLRGLKNE